MKNQTLIKIEAISCVKELMQVRSLDLTHALCEAASRPWGSKLYSWATLEKWYYTYRNHGLSALEGQQRKDKGRSRVLSQEQKELLVRYRTEHPELTVRTLVRHLQKEYPTYQWSHKESTIHRYLNSQNLGKVHLETQILSPVSKKFETECVNELWMTDAMHGPSIKPETERAHRTFLIAFIDDHSRIITGSAFHRYENTESLLDVLYQALTRRGIPKKIYTDQGKIFICEHLKQICANLDIRLIHAQPYSPQSKGKIERFFRTVQTEFIQGLKLNPVSSLHQLNRIYNIWLESTYHIREHSSIAPDSPATRFQKQSSGIHWVKDENTLKNLFLCRKKRKVQKDGTIRINKGIWEVASSLRSQTVEIRYNPFDTTHVEIYYQGNHFDKATPCNPHQNAYQKKKEQI